MKYRSSNENQRDNWRQN